MGLQLATPVSWYGAPRAPLPVPGARSPMLGALSITFYCDTAGVLASEPRSAQDSTYQGVS